jgi:hypothetical protein
MAIAQVLYVSRSLVSDSDLSAEMVKILETARRFNARVDATGCLSIREGFFFQVVEGPAKAVDAVMARIAVDRRHADIEVKLRREVASRSFSDWRMAHVHAEDGSGPDPRSAPAVVLLAELMRLSDAAARPA